jgi:Ni/Fe-hydrogenase 1 B-type cytochrome subunit
MTPATAPQRNTSPPSGPTPRTPPGRGKPLPTRLPREGNYRWVYIWGKPMRLAHWLSAAAFTTLILTGLFIGMPNLIPIPSPSQGRTPFLMGWVRSAHFIAAFVLVTASIFRMYWLNAGNRYEQLRALFPFTKRDRINLGRQTLAYLFVRPHRAPHYIGHNPLQQLAYTGLYTLAIVAMLTGFSLYVQYDPGSMSFRLLSWVPSLFGGLQNVRLVHHVLTWAFAIYIPLHIYLASRADILEHGGLVSSMVTGGRFVPAETVFEDERDLV